MTQHFKIWSKLEEYNFSKTVFLFDKCDLIFLRVGLCINVHLYMCMCTAEPEVGVEHIGLGSC